MRSLLPILLVLSWASLAHAHLAAVVGVDLTRRPDGLWDILMRVSHEDQGWSHFCDRIDVLDQDGLRMAFRHLSEPKIKDVEEDGPVRRRWRGVPIPPGVVSLTFQAHCKVSGWGGATFQVDLANLAGPGFRIDKSGPPPLPTKEDVERFFVTPRARRLFQRPQRFPYPPNSPVPPRPADPLDARPRVKREPR